MGVIIKDIAYDLPEATLTNEALAQQYPDWDMVRVERRAGVHSRHIASEDQTALDLASNACKKLFAANDGLHDAVDTLIFCTQSPDHVIPPNACVLHGLLELRDEICAFDVNHACSGYVYGLALARGLILSGMAKDVLLVNADTYSKYIHRDDRSSRVLFGDAGAASWIRHSDASQGLIDVQCATSGQDYKLFCIPAGGCRMPKSAETAVPIVDDDGNTRTLEQIHMDGFGILSFVSSKVVRQIADVLKNNSLKVDDVDLFVFHQASKMVLDSLARLLRIPAEKVVTNVETLGNTVSASIPIAVKDVMDSQQWRSGSTVILSGFGAGLSWATALLEV